MDFVTSGRVSRGARNVGGSRMRMAVMVVLQLVRTSAGSTPQPAGSGSAAQAFEQLTPQEQTASQIAEQNGDREYLMVDKAHGRIRLFNNGAVVFTASALTGENKSDRLPADTLKKEFAQLGAFDDKVTPAGRFTVAQDYDTEYGTVLEINEIQGPDWTIAIHQVYLGIGTRVRRRDGLATAYDQGAYITHGCINVVRERSAFLLLLDPINGTLAHPAPRPEPNDRIPDKTRLMPPARVITADLTSAPTRPKTLGIPGPDPATSNLLWRNNS